MPWGYDPLQYTPSYQGITQGATQIAGGLAQAGKAVELGITNKSDMEREYKKATDFKGQINVIGGNIPEPPAPGPATDPATYKSQLEAWGVSAAKGALPAFQNDPAKLESALRTFESSWGKNADVSQGVGRIQFQQGVQKPMERAAAMDAAGNPAVATADPFAMDAAAAGGTTPDIEAQMVQDPKVLYTRAAAINFGTPAGEKALDRLHDLTLAEMKTKADEAKAGKKMADDAQADQVAVLKSVLAQGNPVYYKGTKVRADIISDSNPKGVDASRPQDYEYGKREYRPYKDSNNNIRWGDWNLTPAEAIRLYGIAQAAINSNNGLQTYAQYNGVIAPGVNPTATDIVSAIGPYINAGNVPGLKLPKKPAAQADPLGIR
jgi:hypothetical protein